MHDLEGNVFCACRYLVLEGESPHSSLALCCQTEAVADELKPLCSAAGERCVLP